MNKRCAYFGNVTLGTDVSLEELRMISSQVKHCQHLQISDRAFIERIIKKDTLFLFVWSLGGVPFCVYAYVWSRKCKFCNEFCPRFC